MILSKEQFMEVIKSRVGSSTSDEDLKFVEDMTDTYNDLASSEKNDWKEKYEQEAKARKELDESWRTRYKERFFNNNTNLDTTIEQDKQSLQEPELTPEEQHANEVTFDDLFKE